MATLFFDFDGVLVRSRRPDRSFCWAERLEEDLGISPELQKRIFDSQYWHPALQGLADARVHWRTLFGDHGFAARMEEFIHYWLQRDCCWRPDVLALARQLVESGHQLFIATNQDRLRGEYIKTLDPVRSIFSGVFTSSDLGVAKPDLNFFIKVRERWVGKSDSDSKLILIDDDPRNVSSARQAGWQAIHFDPDLDPSASVGELQDQIGLLLRP